MTLSVPSLELERHWMSSGVVAGMDEVGRGALAGPVAVGACVPGEGEFPQGLTDSKKLTPRRREDLFTPLANWARALVVGMASAAEVDSLGISGALQLAGWRALGCLTTSGAGPQVVILDGKHDWLSVGGALFSAPDTNQPVPGVEVPRVVTAVKADLQCASVAAASVAAKVARDNLLQSLPDRGYGFAKHKGYGAAAHRQAIATLGASAIHRQSWNLTGGASIVAN
ncbi:MAG: ribonuclease HII [Actinomycetaceae bacterium]|nr:ribonuclease HII [Actinomycetaceae bacterium]